MASTDRGFGGVHAKASALIALVLTGAFACAQRSDTTSTARDTVAADTNFVPAYGGRLRVPPGFHVDSFARVPDARFMAIGPDGAVYITSPGGSAVYRLDDRNGDGYAETRTTVLSGLNEPHGIAFRGDTVYVAETDHVIRVQLDASGRPVGAPQTVASYAGGGMHFTRTVIFGSDGAMYLAMGSDCNVCAEGDPMRAAVTRFDANGSRIFAKGLRNAVGLAVEPSTGKIWATQNERDMLRPSHENLPPDEINILVDGGDYGWPYCYGDRVPNPEYSNPSRCAPTIPPALAIQAHSAPLGITFLKNAALFPADWRGDALVALHGSWNRDVPTGAKVIRVRVQNGLPTGYEDFIVGWQRADGSRWGRPADVVVRADGSVLVSDDMGDMIYRVWH